MSIVRTFAAADLGDCRCGNPIWVGQIVHELSNGEVVHEGCAL